VTGDGAKISGGAFLRAKLPRRVRRRAAQFETLSQDIADRIADVEGSSSAAPVMSPRTEVREKPDYGPLFFGFLLSFVIA
jgi:hypothetical protein